MDKTKNEQNKLWGEPEEVQQEAWEEVVPKEIKNLIILSAIKHELPKDKQPQPTPAANADITIGPEHSRMEENVLYTIQLIQHARKVSKLINQAKSASTGSSQGEGASNEVTECPPMPVKPASIQEKQSRDNTLPLLIKRESEFSEGVPLVLPILGKEVSKEILYKTVGSICAHAGFDSALQSSLQILTDVADDFLRRFTTILRSDVDNEALYGNSGFPDAMERVFHEMGFGSMACLHDFYQKRILQYRDKCEARSLSLVQQYQALLPTIKTEPEQEVVRFKREMDTEEEIPELHFPAMVEGDCEEDLQSSLEPGFQMLQSLEQEVGMKFGS